MDILKTEMAMVLEIIGDKEDIDESQIEIVSEKHSITFEYKGNIYFYDWNTNALTSL